MAIAAFMSEQVLMSVLGILLIFRKVRTIIILKLCIFHTITCTIPGLVNIMASIYLKRDLCLTRNKRPEKLKQGTALLYGAHETYHNTSQLPGTRLYVEFFVAYREV